MRLYTDNKKFNQLFLKLIEECDCMFFATAWASYRNEIFTSILKNRKKIKKGVIGLNYYQTDPDVLDEFIGNTAVRFIMREGGIFHPKVYLFVKRTSWHMLIGSANLTKAAFNFNQECMLHLNSKEKGEESPLCTDAQCVISQWWAYADIVSAKYSAEYRAKWQKPQRGRRELEGKPRKIGNIPFSELIWNEFFEQVKADEEHNVEGRVYILSQAHKWFKQYGELCRMPDLNRKLIAGTTRKKFNAVDFQWFGNMGRGVFQNLIRDNDQNISDALNNIPLSGPVTLEHYRAYYQGFSSAFTGGKGHALGVASRLLAMKRPDYFLCWNGGNKTQFCKALGITMPNLHDYERYWTDVIENIVSSVWWHAPEPANELEKSVWKGRAAMLDAIFYVPV